MKPIAPLIADHLYATVRSVSVRLLGLDDLEQAQEPEHGASDRAGDHADEGKAESQGKDDDGAGWRTVFQGSSEVDLFDQSATGTFISRSRVPIGTITAMRLVIDGVRFVSAAGSFQVKCSSCAESGLKLKFDQPIAVQPGQRANVLIVFDRDHSLWTDEKGYVLSPVLHAEVSVAP